MISDMDADFQSFAFPGILDMEGGATSSGGPGSGIGAGLTLRATRSD